MNCQSKASPSLSQPGTRDTLVSGRWSGMIPRILELGSRDCGDEIDLADLNELFAMGMIDAPGDDRHPPLSNFGLAVYEYLTRF
ncbi:MAG TPA: hypothetical protein VGH74_20340, partial [Planctomycetaceae bacterium]